MSIDIKSIVTFLEVADTKSFSASADNLCVTQPAVSKRVAMLEEELSTQLFDRVGKTIRLTEAGRLLIPPARRITAALEHIEAKINNINGMNAINGKITGTLRLGVSPYVANEYLPDILHRFRSEYPEVEISLVVKQSPRLLDKMESGAFEICLCELCDSRTDQFIQHTVAGEELRIVVSPSHPLGALSDINTSVLTNHRAVLPPEDNVMRMVLSNAFDTIGYRQHNPIVVPDLRTLKSMVENGIGWSILPKSMCESYETLQVLDVAPLDLNFGIFLIHPLGRTLSQAATVFAQAMRLPIAANTPLSGSLSSA